MKAAALFVLGALLLAGCSSPPAPSAGNTTGGTTPSAGGAVNSASGTHLLMNTSLGDIRLLLYTNITTATSGSFVNLTKQGYFDGQRFHRVIGPKGQPPDGFMDQAGDPNSKDPAKQSQWGSGGPGYSLPDEFACKDGTVSSTWTGAGRDPCKDHGGLRFLFDHAGIMAMANTGSPNSGGSQFFLTLAPASFLNGGYPVFGEVEGGLDVVKAIGNVETVGPPSDRPVKDVLINKVTVVS